MRFPSLGDPNFVKRRRGGLVSRSWARDRGVAQICRAAAGPFTKRETCVLTRVIKLAEHVPSKPLDYQCVYPLDVKRLRNLRMACAPGWEIWLGSCGSLTNQSQKKNQREVEVSFECMAFSGVIIGLVRALSSSAKQINHATIIKSSSDLGLASQ